MFLGWKLGELGKAAQQRKLVMRGLEELCESGRKAGKRGGCFGTAMLPLSLSIINNVDVWVKKW